MANPNPSPETRFKPGDEWAGNGKGKTSAHRKAEVRAAEISATLREKALSEMLEKIEAGEMTALDAVTSDFLRLFKDSEDRAHGTPKQAVEVDMNAKHVVSHKPVTPEEWAKQFGDGS